jgi:hypothetical protein
MNVQQWEREFEQAFQLCDLDYHPMYSSIAHDKREEDKSKAVDMHIAMERYFWHRVCARQPFGDVGRVAEKFGSSVEENYGVKSGPFVDLAACYFTFQIEMHDILPSAHNTWLAQALMAVEHQIRILFFPTPGPLAMPKRVRKAAQRDYLRQNAPQFSVERYIKDNPMLRGWLG